MTSKEELLRKLKALAESGVGGEKINAQKKLGELMIKFGISEEEICDDIPIACKFTYHGEDEKVLLRQIIYKVTDSTNIYGFEYTRSGRACRTKMGCIATKAQQIEIEFLFDFHKKLYKKEVEIFRSAFIQKHKLFGKREDGDTSDEIDYEELIKMSQFMGGMSDETPLKQITEGTK